MHRAVALQRLCAASLQPLIRAAAAPRLPQRGTGFARWAGPGPSARAAGTMAAAAAAPTAALDVVRVPCLSDNYVWLLREPSSGAVAVVDPAEVAPVVQELKSRGWTPGYILNTHHHWDHTGGNLELKGMFPGLQIVGPRADAQRIPGIDVQLGDGDAWRLGALEMRVFDTPGHTRGHISLWFPEAEALFCGDTLFALGCGRLFEGDAPTMWSSLSKLKALPPSTRVYCAHEYTQSNARFAVTVDPGNERLLSRQRAVDEARRRGEPTVPSLLGEELETNPFLRPDSAGVRAGVGAPASASDWEVFGLVRQAKDSFR